ncbi:MAG: RBBP9/YdeN family alpha/beta hydrolase [Acidobacteriaceae bacterium]
MKRVIIVHGWDGYPEEGWFPWLKSELESRGFEVLVPQMPEADKPRIFNWVPKLAEVVGKPDNETYLVGHSMGCQTIARYLETLPDKEKVGGVVFVAGYFKHLENLEDEEEVREIAKHWLEAPIDLYKVKNHLPKSVAIFSDDDPFVPLDNQDDFKDKLGSKIVVEHQMNHFSGSRGITKLPAALSGIMELAGSEKEKV